mgnify:FL=1
MENNIKRLANMAKQRMLNRNYGSAINKNNKIHASDYYYKNAMSLRKSKAEAEFVTIDISDEKFESKVIGLLENNDLLNPIGKLVDKSYFNTLNDFEKQHYILSLCDKFNKVKEKFDLDLQKIS